MRRTPLLCTLPRPLRDGLLVALSLATALVWPTLPARSQPAANARPTGATVVAGSVSVAQSANTTIIDQASQRAAINWQNFDIGSQQTVLFQQPSSSAVALNRVIGPNPSQIAGQIDANGQVVITNQSGVTFYRGSQVNTAGLMVSAAGIGITNFMAGRMVFNHAAHPNAAVTNAGIITVRDAGLAALVAPQVANSGVIDARLGHVVLAGARTATLDLYGDGLLAIDVTRQVVQAPDGTTALVTNTGLIRADGGTVQLTARAADGVVQTLVDAGGTIHADTVGGHTGAIVLNGVGGDITVAGQLDAAGTAPGTAGGNIDIDGSGSVAIASAARIDASGGAGGGTIAIGTTLARAVGTTLARAAGGPGTQSTQTAANVSVAAGATIAANATAKGNGGRITLMSRQATSMDGTISATGGPDGGNGGFVETSGPMLNVGNAAVVDANATSPSGTPGTWLLDPLDLNVIGSGTDMNVNQNSGTAFTVTPTGAPSQILNDVIDRELDGGTDVILTTEGTVGAASGNITVDAGAPITWVSGATLTMNAAGGIFIDAAISNTPPPLNAAYGTLVLNASGAGIGITQDPINGAIWVQNLAIASAGPVTLTAANAIENLAASVTGAQNFSFRDDSTALTIGTVGAVTGITTGGGAVSLATTTNGNITVDDPIASGGGAIGIATAPGSAFANYDTITSGGGSIVLLGDTLALNTDAGAIDAGTGTVVLGPATPTLNVLLGATSDGGALSLQTADLGTITAGMVQIGYRAEDGAPSFTGNITVGGAAGIALNAANVPALLLVTGGAGTVSQTEPISLPGGSLGIIADANVTMSSGNSVGTFAGFTDGGLLSFSDGVALTAGNMPLPTLGVAVDATTGLASLAPMATGSGLPGNPLSGTTTSGSLSLGATGGLTLAANLTANGQMVTLGANDGAINQTAGTITAGTLTGGAWTRVALNDSNDIAALDTFAATAGFSLVNGANLTVAGTVTGLTNTMINSAGTLTVTGSVIANNTVGLTGGSIAIGNAGLVTDGGAGNTTLTATNGTITETGTLLAGTLSGSATGAANLPGATMFSNQVATLSNFSANNLTLIDANPLTITGPVTANYLNVTASGKLVLAGNIATLGAPLTQQSGSTPAARGSTLQVTAPVLNPGAGAQFIQTGTVTLSDPPGTTLRVQLPASGGSASFANLVGTGANLVLAVGSGTATGTTELGGLLVIGQGGSVTLTGSIAGVTTSAAAALGQIIPAINASYTFNACTIGLAACGGSPIGPSPPPVTPLQPASIPNLDAQQTAVLGGLIDFLPGPRLPPLPALPVLDVTLLPTAPLQSNQLAPQDVVPPNISFEDY